MSSEDTTGMPEIAGAYSQSRVSVTRNARGEVFSVTVDDTFRFDGEPTDSELADVHTKIAENAAAEAQRLLDLMGAAQTPAPPQSPPVASTHPQGGDADALRAAGNGDSQPQSSNWKTVEGRYGEIAYPSTDVLSTDMLKSQVAANLKEQGYDPAHFRVWDNRGDLDKGQDRSGHAGAVKMIDGAPGQDTVGKRAAFWVDFWADSGKMRVTPTKVFKELPPLALGQLADTGSGGAPPAAPQPDDATPF